MDDVFCRGRKMQIRRRRIAGEQIRKSQGADSGSASREKLASCEHDKESLGDFGYRLYGQFLVQEKTSAYLAMAFQNNQNLRLVTSLRPGARISL